MSAAEEPGFARTVDESAGAAIGSPTDSPNATAPRRRTRSLAALEPLEISKRPNPIERLKHVWLYRELLANLVRKELKVKYKDSVLGFMWSLLNPALQIGVYSLVFGVIFPAGIPMFAIFMICGLLPWTFFTNALGGGTGAIVGNSQLVNKVWFPREILPFASVGAALVHWGLQSIVLVLALILVGKGPVLAYLPLLPLAIIALIVVATAMAVALSAVNVYLRDTQHLLELVLLAWFWFTPIVYGYPKVGHQLSTHGYPAWIGYLNPVTPVVVTFQRVLYHTWVFNDPHKIGKYVPDGAVPAHSVMGYFLPLILVLAAGLVLLWLALMLFGRLEDNFGEEI